MIGRRIPQLTPLLAVRSCPAPDREMGDLAGSAMGRDIGRDYLSRNFREIGYDGDKTSCSEKDWNQLLCSEMEVRKLIGKPLQPARPIRRVDKGPMLVANDPAVIMDSFKEDIKENYNLWCSYDKLDGLVHEPVIPECPKTETKQTTSKADRITYSRDDLLRLGSLSVSKEKPKYLPDHPIVLKCQLSDLKGACPLPTSQHEAPPWKSYRY